MYKVFLFIFFVFSCQTLKPVQKGKLSRELEQKFLCQKNSGLLAVIPASDYPSFQMEWLHSRGRVEIAVLDPFLTPVLRGTLGAGQSFWEPKLAQFENLEKLKISQDFFLHYNGNELPIRLGELACLFSGDFPSRWRAGLSKSGSSYLTDLDRREIFYSVTSKSVCTLIRWKGFFYNLVAGEIKMCSTLQKNKGSRDANSTLFYEEKEIVTWKNL